MGRVKLEIKKIENQTNRHVTFAKRKNGVMKKAKELSILCDVDIAVIVFSSSGKVSSFCRDDRLEDVISRFSNTPSNERMKRKLENLEFLNKIVKKFQMGPDPNQVHQLQQQLIMKNYGESNVVADELQAQVKKLTIEGEAETAAWVLSDESISNISSKSSLDEIENHLRQFLLQTRLRQQELDRFAVFQNSINESYADWKAQRSRQESNLVHHHHDVLPEQLEHRDDVMLEQLPHHEVFSEDFQVHHHHDVWPEQLEHRDDVLLEQLPHHEVFSEDFQVHHHHVLPEQLENRDDVLLEQLPHHEVFSEDFQVHHHHALQPHQEVLPRPLPHQEIVFQEYHHDEDKHHVAQQQYDTLLWPPNYQDQRRAVYNSKDACLMDMLGEHVDRKNISF